MLRPAYFATRSHYTLGMSVADASPFYPFIESTLSAFTVSQVR